jgi:hypothetical protein
VAGGEGVVNENGRRALALTASVALVGVALFIRGRGDDGSGGGGGGDGSRTLVCPPELRTVCETAAADDYDVRIEDVLTTADALTAGDVDGDVWLVPKPWHDAVSVPRELNGQDPVLGAESAVVARSPVVLVVAASRVDALTTGACGGTVAWACVGDVADGPWTDAGGQPNWGEVRAGVARPDGAAGLTLLGAAAADFLDDPGFASNDFGGALDNWLSKLAASSSAAGGPDPVAAMITQGPGHLAVLGTLEAFAGQAAGHEAVRVVVPEPVVTADLVAIPLVQPGDDNPDSGVLDDLVDDDLSDALAEAGWRVDGHDLAPGLDPDLDLPDPDEPGVPRGDVLRALLQRWMDLV